MTKKIFTIIIMSILLCGCGNIETDTANQVGDNTAEAVTEAPIFPVSSYIDMSDMTFVESEEILLYDYTNNYLGEAVENMTTYNYMYTTPDDEHFVFDENNRLRIYHNFDADETPPDKRFKEEELREICDNVLREFIVDYDKYEYCDSTCYYGETVYELSLVYETDTEDNGARISLSESGEVKSIAIHYRNVPTEEQIDHEYFDTLFEKQIDTMFDNNAHYHHYTLDRTTYTLYDNYVYAEYNITTYDDPIVEGSENPEDFPAFCHTFGFLKTLE